MSEQMLKEQIKVIDQAIKESNRSKETALKTLQNAGILTSSGKLSKTYGGK